MATRATHPTTQPTTVVLVRHGTTSTTGKLLPGRAPGLHLSDLGRYQADAAAARSLTSATSPRSTRRRWSAPGRRLRRSPEPTGCRVRVRHGLIECDFGDWTGRNCRRCAGNSPSGRGAMRSLHLPFPGGESFVEMQTRISTTAVAQSGRRAPRGDHRVRLARRPHQGGRGPRPGNPPRPVPAHRHLAVLADADRCSARAPPIVLAVNSTGRRPLAPPTLVDPATWTVPSISAKWLTFAAGTEGPTGERVFYLQAGHPHRDRHAQGREATGRASRRLPRAAAGERRTCPKRPRRTCPTSTPPSIPNGPSDRSWWRSTEQTEPDRGHRREDASRRRRVHDPAGVEAAEARFALSPGQVEAFMSGARRRGCLGRPVCPLCNGPIDTCGHACPRMN